MFLVVRSFARLSMMLIPGYLDLPHTYVASASCNKDVLVRYWGQKVKVNVKVSAGVGIQSWTLCVEL